MGRSIGVSLPVGVGHRRLISPMCPISPIRGPSLSPSSRPHAGPFERGDSLPLYAQQPIDARLLRRLELQMTFNSGCDKRQIVSG
jgi:hypothetical protein